MPIDEQYEPYQLAFNECKKWGKGNILKSDIKVPLPKRPPVKVNYEILGIGHMSHMRKGTKYHEYNFRRESLTLLYFLDPDP